MSQRNVAPSFSELDKLSEEDFNFFREFIFKVAGISMSEKKRDLVVTRIKSYLRKGNYSCYSDYRKALEKAPIESKEVQTFINLLTTNKTNFFREPDHFNFLSRLVSDVNPNRTTDYRVWCCASSTGEEVYTIAMILKRYLPSTVDFQILATDIDTSVLGKAQNGVYANECLREIPNDFQNQFIKKGHGEAAGWFKVNDSIHQKIHFQQHNLNSNEVPEINLFDIVFCRNVLIYFAPDTIKNLTIKLNKALKPGGYLFIGHSEAIRDTNKLFKQVEPSIYTKI
jgi:chemotaxis protein methyltransferase CheR